MPRHRIAPLSIRRHGLITILQKGRIAIADLVARSGVSRRTIEMDLAMLRRLPDSGLRREREGRTLRLSWEGPAPLCLDPALECLAEREFVALVVARGLLRQPGAGGLELGSDRYAGHLDGALDGLLRRSGLAREAAAIAPESIQVSRFAARKEDPGQLAAVLRAVVTGHCLRFTYCNLRGERHPVHTVPGRVVLIRGEFFLFASAARRADGRPELRQYRIARMTEVTPTPQVPPGASSRVSQEVITNRLLDTFGATGSDDPRRRRVVRLAVGPTAWPHLEDRVWGPNQRWDHAPTDLPAGWRRLVFTTAGLDECRHWVLSFGASVRAEAPKELVAWLRGQATAILGRTDV